MRRPSRRLTILDAVALVAATALGFAFTHALWDALLREYFYEPQSGWTVGAALAKAPLSLLVLIPLLMAWTFTLVPLRLLQPRPPLRRLLRQPGLAASGAAILAMAVTHLGFLAQCAVGLIVMGEFTAISASSASDYFFIQIAPSTVPIACAILTAWMILAITRMGRPEPSWIDRTGQILGVLWIATAVCQWWYGVTGELAVPWNIAGPP
jgi:hypothetical protein